jgi:hypothetical protein
VTAGELEGADRISPRDRLADGHRRGHRLVRRPCLAVVDDDDAPAGQPSGVPNGPGQGGVHGLAGGAGQVHPR